MPRVVFRVAVTGAGVIPLCVTAGLTSTLEYGCASVAAECFADGGCGTGAVADTGFSDAKHGVADTSFSDVAHDASDVMLSVAIDAFSVADVGFSDTGHDGPLGVALDAFGGG